MLIRLLDPDARFAEKTTMNQRQRLFLSTFVLAFGSILPGSIRAQNSSSSGQTKAYTPVPGFDASAMDMTADPCVDFYQYACGNFSKNHPLPNDRPSFDEFTNLREYNTQVLHKILEQAAAAHARAGSDEQKIGDYYASCMDTAAIEKKGLAVLNPQLNAIAALKDKAALTPLIASMEKFETGAFFAIGSQQDFKNAELGDCRCRQGGLGLPEKDYYLRTDAKSVQTRAQYVQHLTNMLKLMGEPPAKAASDAAAVMAFETALAKSSMSAVDRRDPANIYHVMTVDALAELPTLNLKQLLASSGVPHVGTLNVASPEFFKNLDKTLQQTDLETLKTYLRIRLVESETMRLPKAFDDEHFNFFQHQAPRHSRTGAPIQTLRGPPLTPR